MANATLRTAEDNIAKYYFTHCIEGINAKIIGDNLVNVYVTNDPLKYEIYLEVQMRDIKLDKHKQKISSCIFGDNILYSFGVPDKYKSDYRHFRNNECERFSDKFKQSIFELSGYKYKKKEPTGEIHTDAMITLLDDSLVPLFIKHMLIDIKNRDLYDEFEDCPFADTSSGITTWTGVMSLIDRINKDAGKPSIDKNKVTIARMRELIVPWHKFINVDDSEFIENHPLLQD